MPRPSRRPLLVVAALFCPLAAMACLWDYDTLQMERSRFPTTLELITGKFLRHSQEFYEWRIRDRIEKLRSEPDNLAYYDDLAVAYEKTGQHQKAIDTILAKDARKPGLYETEANLGTFYIHSGQLDKGLVHIGRALHINPEAHFGREKYQKLLVEYVLSRRKDGQTKLPLMCEYANDRTKADPLVDLRAGFASFVFPVKENEQSKFTDATLREPAIQGVLGMMKFGNYDSPILLEALGNLLASPFDMTQSDAKRLACRAYLKASYEVSDPEAKKDYRAMAGTVLRMQTRHPLTTDRLPLEELEATFRQELDDAHEWYENLRNNELTWIQEGKDPEYEFTRTYYEEPTVVSAAEPSLLAQRSFWQWVLVGGGVFGALVVAVLVAVVVVGKAFRSLRAGAIDSRKAASSRQASFTEALARSCRNWPRRDSRKHSHDSIPWPVFAETSKTSIPGRTD
jgi:tetratricopeptide (TPR) repeat protein